jgi:hypothetical protein
VNVSTSLFSRDGVQRVAVSIALEFHDSRTGFGNDPCYVYGSRERCCSFVHPDCNDFATCDDAACNGCADCDAPNSYHVCTIPRTELN